MSLWNSITELARSNSIDVLYDEVNSTVMVNGAPYATPLRSTISISNLVKLPFEPSLNFIKRSFFAADQDVIASISHAIATGLFTITPDGALTAYSHSTPGEGRVFFGTYDHCSSDDRPYVMVEIDPMDIVAYEPEAPKGVCSEYKVIAEFNTTPDFSSLSWDDDSGMTDAIAQAVHLYSPVQPGPLYDLSKVEPLVRTEQPVVDSSEDEFEDSSSEYLDDE
jgi:hypothetical protein